MPIASRWLEAAGAESNAFADPDASRDYVRSLSHEMSDEVCAAHIALYVNASSVEIGDEGMAAIDRLLGRAAAAA